MAATYEPIATYTFASAGASYTFSSIPTTYTDLVLVSNYSQSTSNYGYVRVGNGSVDSGANYSQTNLIGNGTAASSTRRTGATAWFFFDADNSGAGAMITSVWQINNYSNATTYKTTLDRDNNAAASTYASVGLWRSTSAINTLSVTSAGTFASGSTFTLYGIKAA